jgi:hypothetical protein
MKNWRPQVVRGLASCHTLSDTDSVISTVLSQIEAFYHLVLMKTSRGLILSQVYRWEKKSEQSELVMLEEAGQNTAELKAEMKFV